MSEAEADTEAGDRFANAIMDHLFGLEHRCDPPTALAALLMVAIEYADENELDVDAVLAAAKQIREEFGS